MWNLFVALNASTNVQVQDRYCGKLVSECIDKAVAPIVSMTTDVVNNVNRSVSLAGVSSVLVCVSFC